jgi:hypothetical protein
LAGLLITLWLGCGSIVDAQGSAATCQMHVKFGDRASSVDLPGFDPSNLAIRLSPPEPGSGVSMIMCRRSTLVPAPTDYRVLKEMKLPFAIAAEKRVLFLELRNGQLLAEVPSKDLTRDEVQSIQAKVNEMQKFFLLPAPRP